MKYKDMTDEQKEAFRGFLLMALTVKTQEEKAYTDQFFRLLMLGNGTGIGGNVHGRIGPECSKNRAAQNAYDCFSHRGFYRSIGLFSANERSQRGNK